MINFNRESVRVKNIREVKRNINRAIKELNKNGVTAVHCKRTHDSRQHLISDINTQIGRDILKDDSYLVVNKIREGKHTTPDTLYLLWKGDVEYICKTLSENGLSVVTPESDKKTIVVNINLWRD